MMEGSAVDPIEILSSFELHELMYQTLSFLNLPVGALEIDASAVAASYAIRKIPHYLQALRQFEDRRRSLGLQTRRELAAAERHRPEDPDLADRLRQEALRSMGDYEIQQHLFVVCAGQIDRLLTLAHRLAGVDLRPDAVAFLDSYRPLRNQFEHLAESLPGQERGGRLVLDVPGRMLLGLTDDGTGRITVRRGGEDVVAEVNEHGVQQFERIVTESFDDIKVACVGYLEQFFQEHPEVAARAHLIRPIVNQRVLEDDGEFA
jgi:hypothetical protein